MAFRHIKVPENINRLEFWSITDFKKYISRAFSVQFKTNFHQVQHELLFGCPGTRNAKLECIFYTGYFITCDPKVGTGTTLELPDDFF